MSLTSHRQPWSAKVGRFAVRAWRGAPSLKGETHTRALEERHTDGILHATLAEFEKAGLYEVGVEKLGQAGGA